jgi:Ca2+-binding RTX toxin-like protein
MLDWQPITDNLSSFILPGGELKLQTIELVNDDSLTNSDDDVILVGGLGGVFRRRVTATAPTNPWCEYGQGLPNVLVTDLEYDLRSDTLVAGTLGRGAWTISNVKSTIGLKQNVQVDGTAVPDTVHIVRNANNPSLLDVFLNVIDIGSPKPTLEVQLSVVQSVLVFGNNGADRLQISSTGGIVRVPQLLDFFGGNDGSVDTLVLNNASDTQNATGSISTAVINSSLASPVTFSGVEAISILLGSGSDNIDGSGANVPLTLVGGGGIDVLRGGSANDTLDGRDGLGFDQLFGGPGNDTALMDQFDFFDGGLNLDGIDFFGTAGNDHIVVRRQVGPDGPQALIEMNSKTQVFNYINGETINVYVGAGNDHVEMDASAGTRWKAQFFGQEGNDRLIGGALDDLIDGGPGNDFLDGAGGDNVLIGGGGHDVLRNGHTPLAVRAIAAASTAKSSGTTTKSSSARLVQAPVQLDNRSRSLDPRLIDNNLLAGYFQYSGSMDLSSSAAVLLERNGGSHVFDEASLNALASGSLSKDDGSVTGSIDRAFATYFSVT